jgi:Repeat of unknown function (DUF5648)
LAAGWNREGVAAYIHLDTAPLFRLNDAAGHNLLTAQEGERNALVAGGWDTRGSICYVYKLGNEVSGLIPLYRLNNNGTHDHIFTVNATERSTLIAAGWTDEGVGCYVFSQSGTGRTALYRAYNPTTLQHLYTSDPSEYNGLSASWNREGVAAYVPFQMIPRNLIAASTGSGKVTLYWERLPQAAGYNVYRGTTAGAENYAAPANGATLVNTLSYPGSDTCMFTDTGRTDGTEYFYTVKAKYSSEESGPSNEDSDIADPNGIPWTSSNPTDVLNAVRALYANSAVQPIGVLCGVGPDGQIYSDGQTQVLPPDSTEIPVRTWSGWTMGQ